MVNPQPENKVSQKAKAGRDIKQSGRDSTNTTNISLWIPFLLVGVLALGGLAWLQNIGRGSGDFEQTPQPSPASTK